MSNRGPTAEEISGKIVTKGDWHETRQTYSPTYIDYEKLHALITAALKEAIAGANERAAKIADRHAEPVEGEPAKWGQGYTAAAATIAIQIRNLLPEHQEGGVR